MRARDEGAVYFNLYTEPKNGQRHGFSAEMHLADAQHLRSNLTKAIIKARAANHPPPYATCMRGIVWAVGCIGLFGVS